jgi:glyoxylase-like metal-dependent hydrolase (beta-lactamase superfamily II)
MKKLIFILLFYFVESFPLVSMEIDKNKNINITYYNVGQGNCVLIERKNQAVLVDCGSTESNGERETDNKPKVKKEEVVNDIQLKIGKENIKDIYVVLTHLDEDHYNLIPLIFSEDKLKEYKNKKTINFIASNEAYEDLKKVKN